VNIVGVAVHEKFGEATAAAIHEQRFVRDEVAADHIGDLHEGALLELHLRVLFWLAAQLFSFVRDDKGHHANGFQQRPYLPAGG
jgi:hypothetical protein